MTTAESESKAEGRAARQSRAESESKAEGRAARQSRAESDVWTVLDLLQWTRDHFSSCGIETPRLDAECLLAFALGVDRLRLYMDFDKPVSRAERSGYRDLVRPTATWCAGGRTSACRWLSSSGARSSGRCRCG
jgi:hypothetical protein